MPDVVQDFKAAAGRPLERFAQDTSQSARKRESWVRIAELVDETEPERAAALADALSGRNMLTNSVNNPFFLLTTISLSAPLCLSVCSSVSSPLSRLVSHAFDPYRLTKNARFGYASELILTHVLLPAPSVFP